MEFISGCGSERDVRCSSATIISLKVLGFSDTKELKNRASVALNLVLLRLYSTTFMLSTRSAILCLNISDQKRVLKAVR